MGRGFNNCWGFDRVFIAIGYTFFQIVKVMRKLNRGKPILECLFMRVSADLRQNNSLLTLDLKAGKKYD